MTTSWLEAKQMKDLGITESMLLERQPATSSRMRSPSPHRGYSRSSGRSSRYHYSRYSRSPSPIKPSGRNMSPTSSHSRKKVTSSSNKERSSSQESNLSGYTSVATSQDSRSRSKDRSTQDRPSSRTSQLSVKDGNESVERSSSKASINSQSTNEMDKSEKRKFESQKSLRTKRRYESEDDFADSETDHAKSKKDYTRPPEKKRPREGGSNDKSVRESTQTQGHKESTAQSGRSSSKNSLATHKNTPSKMDMDEDEEIKKVTPSNETRKGSSAHVKDSNHETTNKKGKAIDVNPSTKRKYHSGHDDSKSSNSEHEHSSKHKHHKKSRTDKKSKSSRRESVSSVPSEDNASEITRKSIQPLKSDTTVSLDTPPANRTSETFPKEQAPNVADVSLMIKKALVANKLNSSQHLPPSTAASNEGTVAVPSTDPPNYDFERDETPPAELLEATHHLAQGDYAEWYHWTVKNNPAALQQVFQQLSSQGIHKTPMESTAPDIARKEKPDQVLLPPSPVPTALARDELPAVQAVLLQNRIGQQDVTDQSLAGPSQTQQRNNTHTYEHMQLQRSQTRADTGSKWNQRGPPYQDYERRTQPLGYTEPVFRGESPLQSRNDPVLFSRGDPPREPHSVIPRSAEHPREQQSFYSQDYPLIEQPSLFSRSELPRRGLLEPLGQLVSRIDQAREQPLFSSRGGPVRGEPPLIHRGEPLMPRPPGNESLVVGQESFVPRREALLSPPCRRNPLIGGEPPISQNEFPPIRSRYSPTQREMGYVRRDETSYRGDVPLRREDSYLTRDQQSFIRGEHMNRNDPVFNRDDYELGKGYLRTIDPEIQLYQLPSQQRRQEHEPPALQQPLSIRPIEMWSDEVRREAEVFFKRYESRSREGDGSGERSQDDSFRSRLLQQSNLPSRSHDQHSSNHPVRINPEHLRQSPLFDLRSRSGESLGSVHVSPITPRQNLSASSGDHIYHTSPHLRPDSGFYHHTTSSDHDGDYPSHPSGIDGTSAQPLMPQKAAESFSEQRYLNEATPARWKPPHYHHTQRQQELSMGPAFYARDSYGINPSNVGLTDDDYQNLQRSLGDKRFNPTPVSSEHRPKFNQILSERSVFRPSFGEMVSFKPSPGTAEERSLFKPIAHRDTPPGAAEIRGPSSTYRPIVEEMEIIQPNKSGCPGLESEKHGFKPAVTSSPLRPQAPPTPKPSMSDAGVQADIPCSSSKTNVAAQTEEVTVLKKPVKRKREKVKELSEERKKLACKYRPLQKSLFQVCVYANSYVYTV